MSENRPPPAARARFLHRWRALIIAEVWMLMLLLTLLVALLLWQLHSQTTVFHSGSLLFVAGAVLGEAVRRFRHLRHDARMWREPEEGAP